MEARLYLVRPKTNFKYDVQKVKKKYANGALLIASWSIMLIFFLITT